MITIIAGTNRPASRTALIADNYAEILKKRNIPHKLLKLVDLPKNIFHVDMYMKEGKGVSEEMIKIQEEYVLGISKLIVVVPEYNGGIPGVFKLFIDAVCARKYKENFSGKKISLTGVSAGRAGNLRGLEALTGILNYLGANILPNKLPISSIEKFIGEDQELNPELINSIEAQVDQFLNF